MKNFIKNLFGKLNFFKSKAEINQRQRLQDFMSKMECSEENIRKCKEYQALFVNASRAKMTNDGKVKESDDTTFTQENIQKIFPHIKEDRKGDKYNPPPKVRDGKTALDRRRKFISEIKSQEQPDFKKAGKHFQPYPPAFNLKQKQGKSLTQKMFKTNVVEAIQKNGVEIYSFDFNQKFKILVKKDFFFQNLFNIIKRRYYLIKGVNFVYFRTQTKSRLQELANSKKSGDFSFYLEDALHIV